MHPALYMQGNFRVSVHNDKPSKKIAALLANQAKLVSAMYVQTDELNQWIADVNRLVNQNSVAQYIHKTFSRKVLTGTLVQCAVAYGK